jgi:hypothetical protein
MTVFSATLTVLAYFWVRHFGTALGDPESLAQAVAVVGIALTAIFLRRAIRTSKPLYRSMTVVSAVLMAGAYFLARSAGATDAVLEVIFVAGLLAIVIYLRRAMIGVYGDPR